MSALRVGQRYCREGTWYVVRGINPLRASYLTPTDDPNGKPSGQATKLPTEHDIVDVFVP